MTPTQKATLQVFESLQPGDAVELQQEIKVGFRTWHKTTRGTVVVLVLQREDGELTTVVLDDFCVLRKST